MFARKREVSRDSRTNETVGSMSSRNIRKAVIPAAGLGTRLLPFTKAIPKEMLPIDGKPLIQLAVEEAVASGIETVVLVINKSKEVVAEHFRRDPNLEQDLQRRGKSSAADSIRKLSSLAEIHTVMQDSPRGLADAIASAHSAVDDEAFAVILPDVLIDSEVPATRQLLNCYEKHAGCVVATRLVEPEEVDRYGILIPLPWKDSCCAGRTLRVGSVTERPRPGTVTSRYGILGRYILGPEIFSCIEQTRPGFGGERQLSDALSLWSRRMPLHAYLVEGLHHDSGGLLGYLQAGLAYGLKNPAYQGPLRQQLASLSWLPAVSEPVSSPPVSTQRPKQRVVSYPSQYLNETIQILDRLDEERLNQVVERLLLVRQRGGRLFFLGVGGSAANASHAVNDFRKLAGIECYAPTDNVAELTARINDDGWETSYRDWLQGSRLNNHDAVFILSVGGGDRQRNISANLVSALHYAKEAGASILGIVGRDGGFTAQVADACVVVPVVNQQTVTPHTESFQSLLLHLMVSHPKLKSAPMKWEASAVPEHAA
jgi:D-sedoheptulose 7-phosphate isomerase